MIITNNKIIIISVVCAFNLFTLSTSLYTTILAYISKCTMVELELDSTKLNLFNITWTLVTDDNNLSDFAESLGINTVNTDSFVDIAV